MRAIMALKDVKIQEAELPDGYSIRESNNSREDIEAWNNMMAGWGRIASFPDSGDGKVWIAEYKGEPVGVGRIIIPHSAREDNIIYFGPVFVMEEHRRKGLLRALMVERLKHCQGLNRKYVRFAARKFLDPYFISIGINNEGRP